MQLEKNLFLSREQKRKNKQRKEKIKMKSCNAFAVCLYRIISSGSMGYECLSEEYCDYQFPRDSRKTPKEKVEEKGKSNENYYYH